MASPEKEKNGEKQEENQKEREKIGRVGGGGEHVLREE